MVQLFRHPELVSGPLGVMRLPHEIQKQVQDDECQGGKS